MTACFEEGEPGSSVRIPVVVVLECAREVNEYGVVVESSYDRLVVWDCC